MTTAGRSFLPDSSEKTKPTSTTSPRLQAVILRILLVIPELHQHGVGLRGQRQQAFALVPEILPEPLLDGLEHVLPDREVPLGRRQPEAASHLGAHVHADPRPLRLRLHGARHPCTLRGRASHGDTMVSMTPNHGGGDAALAEAKGVADALRV